MMLERLDHIVIAVTDVDRATRELGRLLGRRPSWRGSHASYGTANTLFRLDKTYVELLAPVGTGAIAELLRRHIERRGEGLFALAFGTDDAEACTRTLRERGLAASDPLDGSGRETESDVERRWRNVMLPESATRDVLLFAIEHRSPGDRLPMAESAEEESAIYGVDHVVVHSTDADATSEIYGRKLGLRLALDRTFPDWGMRLLFFRVGGITIEIAAPIGAPKEDADRLWGISYQVRDADTAVARLAREGFDVSEVRTGRKPGTRVATVRGEPCGVATLLIQPAPRA